MLTRYFWLLKFTHLMILETPLQIRTYQNTDTGGKECSKQKKMIQREKGTFNPNFFLFPAACMNLQTQTWHSHFQHTCNTNPQIPWSYQHISKKQGDSGVALPSGITPAENCVGFKKREGGGGGEWKKSTIVWCYAWLSSKLKPSHKNHLMECYWTNKTNKQT